MRKFAVTVVLLICTSGIPAAPPPGSAADTSRLAVGAIRWDAWYGPRDSVGQAVHASLSPSQWRGRLPFFAEVLENGNITIDGSTQQVVDREIAQAAEAGLDYWAFVTYPAENPLSLGLERYLTSRRRSRLRFCLITECARWREPSFRQRVEDLVREPGYLAALDDRPVLFLGFVDAKILAGFENGAEGFRRVLDQFRSSLEKRGISRPYLVLMDGDPSQAFEWMKRFEGDAISCYATGWEQRTITYQELSANAERFWDRSAATGAAVVPTVMTGWDRRPRVERPVPWEPWQQPGAGLDHYSQPGRPHEIAEHLAAALTWIRNHPESARARTALIYAWNEFDEGGWLAPTLAEGDARLKTIGQVLSKNSPSTRPLE